MEVEAVGAREAVAGAEEVGIEDLAPQACVTL